MADRVLKWRVGLDDTPHRIGCGPVVLVSSRTDTEAVWVWTQETSGPPMVRTRPARVVGTGQDIPGGWAHVGSCVDEPFVWHVYAAT